MRRNSNIFKKRHLFVGLFILLICGISIGYAALQTTLTINGKTKIAKVDWNVHFSNAKVIETNLDDASIDQTITIDNTAKTHATWTVTLSQPGDFYEFSIDVVNEGTLDAKLTNISADYLSEEEEVFANYTINGQPALNSVLKPGNSYTLTFRVEFDEDIEAKDLPTSPKEITLDYELEYVQNRK